MNLKNFFLISGVLSALATVALVGYRGMASDGAGFGVVMDLGESVLHHVDKSLNVFVEFDPAKETAIGGKIYERMIKEGFIYVNENPQLNIYVNDITRVLAQKTKRRGIEYKVHILDTDHPNAFALPGGHIVVTRGLIYRLKTEAELAFVIGHEMTHVDAGHCAEIIRADLAFNNIDELEKSEFGRSVYSGFVRPGFSEFKEKEADRGGIYLSSAESYHPLGAIYALERLAPAPQETGGGTLTPIGDTVGAFGGMVDRYYDTHPDYKNRADEINKYIIEKGFLSWGNKRFYVGEKNHSEKESRWSKSGRPFHGEEYRSEYLSGKKELRAGK